MKTIYAYWIPTPDSKYTNFGDILTWNLAAFLGLPRLSAFRAANSRMAFSLRARTPCSASVKNHRWSR